MQLITRAFLETGTDYCLSPEVWLAAQAASQMTGAVRLKDVARIVSNQSTPPEGERYVLDTGNAREGFLDIPVLGDLVSTRTSAKKIAEEGDVIISRLRPYLRQVTQIPSGIGDILGQTRFYCSTEFMVIRRLDGKNSAGLVAWLLSPPVQEMLSQAATGGHHPRIHADLLLDAPVDPTYLDEGLADSISNVLSQHIQGQSNLRILLRH